MLNLEKYEYVCKTPSEVPKVFLEKYRFEIANAIGQSVSEIFPDFAKAFPLTVEAMDVHWPKPVILCKEFGTDWLGYLVQIRQDLNLFFYIRPAFNPIVGDIFDEDRAMLPMKWRELYRWFHSFTITDKILGIYWINTPFEYGSRLTLKDYTEKLGGTKFDCRAFEKSLNSDRYAIKCWLMTDAGDALFLDEKHCDHKVYHVRAKDFDDAYVLPDPEGTLDRYLAHVVSGHSPAMFDFRA